MIDLINICLAHHSNNTQMHIRGISPYNLQFVNQLSMRVTMEHMKRVSELYTYEGFIHSNLRKPE